VKVSETGEKHRKRGRRKIKVSPGKDGGKKGKRDFTLEKSQSMVGKENQEGPLKRVRLGGEEIKTGGGRLNPFLISEKRRKGATSRGGGGKGRGSRRDWGDRVRERCHKKLSHTGGQELTPEQLEGGFTCKNLGGKISEAGAAKGPLDNKKNVHAWKGVKKH